MKISLKKLLFVVLTVFSVIFIGACGKSKIDKKEVIEKFVEVSKNTKSADMLIDLKMTEKGAKKESVNMKMDSSIILEPLTMRLEMTALSDNRDMKVLSYIKDDYMYIQNPVDNQWFKQPLDELLGQQFKGYITDSYETYDIMKDNVDKIDVVEKDGNYIITIPKNSEFFEEVMKKQISKMSAAGNTPFATDLKIENMTASYIVDKNTYLLNASTMSCDMQLNENLTISMEIDSTMSNINEVKEIVIPEEALSAQEFPRQ